MVWSRIWLLILTADKLTVIDMVRLERTTAPPLGQAWVPTGRQAEAAVRRLASF
jgi:hypothetical protein